MFPIIGIVVVLACIAGGYLIEKGNLLVLMQPAELLMGIVAGGLLWLHWPVAGAACFLTGALLSRFGWVAAGRASAKNPLAVFASQA